MTATDTEYVWARRMTQLVRQHDKQIAEIQVEMAELRDALVNMSDQLDKQRREQLKAVQP